MQFGGSNPVFGFVAPVITRPPLQEGGYSSPDAAPRVLNVRESTVWALKEEEKKPFADALAYFIYASANKSSSMTAQAIGTILKAVNKTGGAHTQDGEMDAERLALAVEQIVMKNKIEAMISGGNPAVYAGFKLGELINIFRPALEEHFLQHAQKQQNMSGAARMVDNLHHGLRNNLVFLAYVTLQAATLPDRLTSWYARSITETLHYGAKAYANSYIEFLKDTLHSVKTPNILFTAIVGPSAPVLRSSQHERFTRPLHLELGDEPPPPLLRYVSGQDGGGDEELLDQVFQDRDEVTVPPLEPVSTSRRLPSASTGNGYQLPNPFKTHPITDVVGGSLSISGGSHTPPNYSFQVDVTVSGPKNLPASVPRGSVPPGFGSVPSSGGLSNTVASAADELNTPIVQAENKYQACLRDRNAKIERVNKIEKSISPDDTADVKVKKSQALVTAVGKAKAADRAALYAAWDVYSATDSSAQREFRDNGVPNDHVYKRNKSIQVEMRNVFGLPWPKKLELEHVAQSTSLATWNKAEGQAKAQLADAVHDNEVITTNRAFTERVAALRQMEASDGPVDRNRFSAGCASMMSLGNKLIVLLHASTTLSPQEAAENERIIRAEMAQVLNHEVRYAKVGDLYNGFCRAEDQAMSNIANSRNPEERNESIRQAAQQRTTFLSYAEELIAQSIGNTEKTAALLQLCDSVKARYGMIVLVNQDRVVRDANQQFEEGIASVLAIENSDDPVDEPALREKIAQAKLSGGALKESMRARNGTTNSLSEPELARCEQQIDDKVTALDRREARYAKLFSDSHEFGELERSLIPALIAGNDGQEVRDGVSRALSDNAIFQRQSAELIRQCPDNEEQNRALQNICKEMASGSAILWFGSQPVQEQSSELLRLRGEMQPGATDPTSRADAVEAFERGATFFSLQRGHREDYVNVVAIQQMFAQHLLEEPSLSAAAIERFTAINQYVLLGVHGKQIKALDVIPLLEAVEKKHSFDAIVLDIGALYTYTDSSSTFRARRWYERCKEKEPDNLGWSRALALNYLHTLNYSQAEQFILKAFLKDPHNETNRAIVDDIVKDKHRMATLVLEWIQTMCSVLTPEEKQAVSKLNKYTVALQTVQDALLIATHPSLQNRWLPSALLLPAEFKNRLLAILAEESAKQSSLFNSLSFATRLIPAACRLCGYFITEEARPKLAVGLKIVAGASKIVQQTLSAALFASEQRDLYRVYKKGELSWLWYAGLSGVSFLTPINTAVGAIYPWLFKDETKRLQSQQAHPALHSVFLTAGSKEFANTVSVSRLLYRSSNLIGRVATKVTGCSSEPVEKLVGVASVLFFFYRIINIYNREYESIQPARRSEEREGLLSRMFSLLRIR